MTKPTILVGIIDHFDPDVQAMIIAKYSRSYGTVIDWLPKTPEEEDSLRARLKQNYVDYGHKSVGQLGDTTIFFEGVSQLVAKAIEDHQLYNGQESSTRYIDFSTQYFYAPKTHDNLGGAIIDLQEELRGLYVDATVLVVDRLKHEFTFDVALKAAQEAHDAKGTTMSGEDVEKLRSKWTNTIKARTFDICRGILPAGAVTNVALSATFDTINDHLGALLHHPLKEVQEVAWDALAGLVEKYPDSTPGPYKLKERFSYMKDSPVYFYPPVGPNHQLEHVLDNGALWQHGWFDNRKKWDMLPKNVSIQQRFRLGGKLDFGAFRDLHRHRNGDCLMPLLTTELGIHPWYLVELGKELGQRLVAIVNKIAALEKNFNPIEYNAQRILLQYAVPMGCRVPIHYDCGLNQLMYLLELRSGKTVHQTLRHYMHDAYRVLEERRPVIAKGIFPDMDEDNFTLKRGEQTFSDNLK